LCFFFLFFCFLFVPFSFSFLVVFAFFCHCDHASLASYVISSCFEPRCFVAPYCFYFMPCYFALPYCFTLCLVVSFHALLLKHTLLFCFVPCCFVMPCCFTLCLVISSCFVILPCALLLCSFTLYRTLLALMLLCVAPHLVISFHDLLLHLALFHFKLHPCYFPSYLVVSISPIAPPCLVTFFHTLFLRLALLLCASKVLATTPSLLLPSPPLFLLQMKELGTSFNYSTW
jgi:hypothetical protein